MEGLARAHELKWVKPRAQNFRLGKLSSWAEFKIICILQQLCMRIVHGKELTFCQDQMLLVVCAHKPNKVLLKSVIKIKLSGFSQRMWKINHRVIHPWCRCKYCFEVPTTQFMSKHWGECSKFFESARRCIKMKQDNSSPVTRSQFHQVYSRVDSATAKSVKQNEKQLASRISFLSCRRYMLSSRSLNTFSFLFCIPWTLQGKRICPLMIPSWGYFVHWCNRWDCEMTPLVDSAFARWRFLH